MTASIFVQNGTGTQAAFTQFFAHSFCAERVKTEAENPTFAAGFFQSRGAPGYLF